MKNLVKLLLSRKHIGIASTFCLMLGATSYNAQAQQWDGTGNLNDPLFRFGRTFIGASATPQSADQQLLLVGNELSDQVNKNIGQWQSGVFGQLSDKDDWITIGKGPQNPSILSNIYGLRINSGKRSLNLFNNVVNNQISPFLQWSDNSVDNANLAQPFTFQSRIGSSAGTNIRNILQLQANGKVSVGGIGLNNPNPNLDPMFLVGNNNAGENKNIAQLEQGTFGGRDAGDRWATLGGPGGVASQAGNYGLRLNVGEQSINLLTNQITIPNRAGIVNRPNFQWSDNGTADREAAVPLLFSSRIGDQANNAEVEHMRIQANGKVSVGGTELNNADPNLDPLFLVGNNAAVGNKNIAQLEQGTFGGRGAGDRWATLGGPGGVPSQQGNYGLRLNVEEQSINLLTNQITIPNRAGIVNRPNFQWSDNATENRETAVPLIFSSRIGVQANNAEVEHMRIQANGKVSVGGTALNNANPNLDPMFLVGNNAAVGNKNIAQLEEGTFGGSGVDDRWATLGGPGGVPTQQGNYGLRLNVGQQSINILTNEVNDRNRPNFQWSDNAAADRETAVPLIFSSRIGNAAINAQVEHMRIQANGKVTVGGTGLNNANPNLDPMFLVGNSAVGENKNIAQYESGTFRGNTNLDRWSELGAIGTNYGLKVRSLASSVNLFSCNSPTDLSRIEFGEFNITGNENLAKPFVIRSQVGPAANPTGRDIIHFLANGRVGIGTPEPVGNRLDLSDFESNNLSVGATVSTQNIAVNKNLVESSTIIGLNINTRTNVNTTTPVTTNSISRGIATTASGTRNNIGITAEAGSTNRIGLLNIGVEAASNMILQQGQINIGVSGTANQNGTQFESSSVGILGDAGGNGGINQVDANNVFSRTRWAGLFRGDLGHTGFLVTASDRKLKENIQSLNISSLNKINLLNPSTYNFNESKDAKLLGLNPNDKQVGFIAQELKEHFPDLVINSTFPIVEKKEDGYETNLVNFEGVNYIGLIPHLVQAIQEQQKMIDSLKVSLNSVTTKKLSEGTVLNQPKGLVKGLEIIGINPNPTSGITYAELSLAGAENVQFTVMDLNGKILLEQQVQGNRVEFNMAGFNAGLYIASIYGNGMVPFTRSFIVK